MKKTVKLYVYATLMAVSLSLISWWVLFNDSSVEDFFNRNLKVQLVLSEDYSQEGEGYVYYSTLSEGRCEVTLKRARPYKNLLLKDKRKDYLFVKTHELSHCQLAFEYRNIENWGFDFDNKEDLIRLMHVNENFSVSYHETYADILASLLLFYHDKLTKRDVATLLKEREKECSGDPKLFCNGYLSFYAYNDVMELINNPDFFNIEEDKLIDISHEVTQKVLLLNSNKIIKE